MCQYAGLFVRQISRARPNRDGDVSVPFGHHPTFCAGLTFPRKWALHSFVLFFWLSPKAARGSHRLDDIGTDFSRPRNKRQFYGTIYACMYLAPHSALYASGLFYDLTW